MSHKQGEKLNEAEVKKILRLLQTDLPMTIIAERFGVTSGAITQLNNRHKIRLYGGKRETWTWGEGFIGERPETSL